MPSIDPQFLTLPHAELADAALSRAHQLGASYADVRIERIRHGGHSLRDCKPEASVDRLDSGLAVRVIWNGAWGFAADVALTKRNAVQVAEQAVATAKVAAQIPGANVELAPEPTYSDKTWISAYDVNPFDVPASQRVAKLVELSEIVAGKPGISHVTANVSFVQENTYFANSEGTSTTQQRVRIAPDLRVMSVSEAGYSSIRTNCPPAGRGWEYLDGDVWDIVSEVEQLPEQLAEYVAAPSVEAGRKDLVLDPTNMWLTIHESVAHGTELDRALGYEAAYAGTSFATFDKLGKLRYGSELMNVTGDRVTKHGLASVGWDHEGVAAQRFDIIKHGILVGYQLNRQMAQEKGFGRSNGCAFADSPGHIPLQRMPNVSLQPLPDGPDTEELISDVQDGVYIVGDNSWSIDMQRFNFQFTGQRAYRIKNGKLAGMLRDVAYQATTTDFWGSMTALGGPQTYVLAGALNCGKGQPGQEAAVSHGCPSALFRSINILNTAAEGGK